VGGCPVPLNFFFPKPHLSLFFTTILRVCVHLFPSAGPVYWNFPPGAKLSCFSGQLPLPRYTSSSFQFWIEGIQEKFRLSRIRFLQMVLNTWCNLSPASSILFFLKIGRHGFAFLPLRLGASIRYAPFWSCPDINHYLPFLSSPPFRDFPSRCKHLSSGLSSPGLSASVGGRNPQPFLTNAFFIPQSRMDFFQISARDTP